MDSTESISYCTVLSQKLLSCKLWPNYLSICYLSLSLSLSLSIIYPSVYHLSSIPIVHIKHTYIWLQLKTVRKWARKNRDCSQRVWCVWFLSFWRLHIFQWEFRAWHQTGHLRASRPQHHWRAREQEAKTTLLACLWMRRAWRWWHWSPGRPTGCKWRWCDVGVCIEWSLKFACGSGTCS
jgi:hypothetical protein